MNNDIKVQSMSKLERTATTFLDLGVKQEPSFFQRAKEALSMHGKTKTVRYNVATESFHQVIK